MMQHPSIEIDISHSTRLNSSRFHKTFGVIGKTINPDRCYTDILNGFSFNWVYAQRYGFVFYTLCNCNRIRFQPYVFLMRAQITQIKYGYTQLLQYHISLGICCLSLVMLFMFGRNEYHGQLSWD